ncbi:ferritin-like domain-containing protein [Plectonema cf. radiosum LEGE 06105]|uniref:Ferritin-like domain-containing protein n=1 Tax=Plectonema cf. radiosum LEGE 06105 TaxID=945769 RepID=A0A8J7F279_9CYAN|nr:ferritin-like domain-containing protein [Plectonema radiosum]MBE9214753.1 ferritin-like domain-containing protein [Plectonema cf. radiosum LEGE 06105]
MNLLTYIMHLAGSGASAYFSALQIRDIKTRPNILAGFQLAESGSVPFLTNLSQRAAKEGDTWLAEKLALHAKDENKHGQIFAIALKQLDKKVRDFKNQSSETREENTTEKKSKPRRSPFFATYYEGYSSEQLKAESIDWNVFMASTYILELDASKDFARMAKVLPDNDSKSRHLKLRMLSIAKDETTHAAYLHEAMTRRMSVTQVEQLVDEWRSRKVNAITAYITNKLQGKDNARSLVEDDESSDKETELIVV